MTYPLAIGHGICSGCQTQLAVLEHTLANAIPDEARADAMRTVKAIEDEEHLVVANEDGTFICPVCSQAGRLQPI
jgi:hypothetical protein